MYRNMLLRVAGTQQYARSSLRQSIPSVTNAISNSSIVISATTNSPSKSGFSSVASTAAPDKESKPQKQELSYDRDRGIISLLHDESASIPLYKTVIGLEIHAQLSVSTKLFSSAPTTYHPSNTATVNPNTSVSLYDIAYPGTLPLLSSSAIQSAVLSAAALGCEIPLMSRFERKHYHYADLPLGYQITQQRWPLAKSGTFSCRRYVVAEKKNKKNKNKNRNKKRKHNNQMKGKENPEDNSSLSKFFSVGIDRIQVEQDTGKTTISTNGDNSFGDTTQSLIDFNRAGSTLIEIVFLPHIQSAHEASSVVSALQDLLKYLGTCDGKMEDGSLRCDLNVSIAPYSNEHGSHASIVDEDEDNYDPYQAHLPPNVGNRVEVKNLNSLKQIIESTEYEALRQAEQRYLLEDPTGRETRTYDVKEGKTVKIRDKGGSADYRFMPEPDLPPLILDEKVLGGKPLETFIHQNVPELPEEVTVRLVEQYGISEDISLIITSDRPAIVMYEKAVNICFHHLNLEEEESSNDALSMKSIEQMRKEVPITIGNWLCNDLFALVKESAMSESSRNRKDTQKYSEVTDTTEGLNHPISIEHSTVNADRLGALVALILKERVSTTQAKKLLEVMYKDELDKFPLSIAEDRKWKLIKNQEELKKICIDVVTSPTNETQLEKYKKGGKHGNKIIRFFVGKIMAASGGNAHPKIMHDVLIKLLEEMFPEVRRE